MDVPSWHPANQNSDALRRAVMSGGSESKRTEFTVVDTSTEEERQLVAKQERAVLGGGRGLLDPSDRMYLLEQTQLEQQATSREQLEREAALQTFRSNALKVQAHKASVPEIPVVAVRGLTPDKKEKAVVVIKAKKRQATPAGEETKAKKTKKSPKKSQTMPGSPAQDAREGRTLTTTTKPKIASKTRDSLTPATTASKSPAAALLLQDYSSSSDEEEPVTN